MARKKFTPQLAELQAIADKNLHEQEDAVEYSKAAPRQPMAKVAAGKRRPAKPTPKKQGAGTRTKPLTAYLPTDLHAWVRGQAQASGMSMTNVVIEALESYRSSL